MQKYGNILVNIPFPFFIKCYMLTIYIYISQYGPGCIFEHDFGAERALDCYMLLLDLSLCLILPPLLPPL